MDSARAGGRRGNGKLKARGLWVLRELEDMAEAGGINRDEAAKRLGYNNRASLLRLLHRHGRTDLWFALPCRCGLYRCDGGSGAWHRTRSLL